MNSLEDYLQKCLGQGWYMGLWVHVRRRFQKYSAEDVWVLLAGTLAEFSVKYVQQGRAPTTLEQFLRAFDDLLWTASRLPAQLISQRGSVTGDAEVYQVAGSQGEEGCESVWSFGAVRATE